MSGRLARLPLRVRLVAGFSAAMLLVLTAAGAFLYWRVDYALDHGLDLELSQAASTLAPLVAIDGSVTDTRAADATGLGWQTVSGDGTVEAHGGSAGTTPLLARRDLARTASGGSRTVDLGSFLPSAHQPYRVRASRVGASYLLVAVRSDPRDEALRELLVQLLVAGLGALVLTALVGERLARFALLPVERYRRRAEEISGGATGLRLEVPVGRDDEVTRLGHTLNDMLAGLERSLERERRFVDEASHELRTPLTLLKSRIQLAVRRERTVVEHREILDELGIDVARLIDLAEELLALGAVEGAAEAVAGESDAGAALVRLGSTRPEVAVTLPAGATRVAVAPIALDRILGNLTDNATTYGAPPVRVDLDVVDGWARLRVVDAGPGMPPELLATATQRFTRAAESRALPGAGLGLALVEALVEGAGGELRLCSRGVHHAVGVASGVACDHDGAMVATVLLPP